MWKQQTFWSVKTCSFPQGYKNQWEGQERRHFLLTATDLSFCKMLSTEKHTQSIFRLMLLVSFCRIALRLIFLLIWSTENHFLRLFLMGTSLTTVTTKGTSFLADIWFQPWFSPWFLFLGISLFLINISANVSIAPVGTCFCLCLPHIFTLYAKLTLHP